MDFNSKTHSRANLSQSDAAAINPLYEPEPMYDQRFLMTDIKISVPFVKNPEFIQEVEPYEPIATLKANINELCLRRENERADNQNFLHQKTVYDCSDPSFCQEPRSLVYNYTAKSPENSTLIFESRFESGNLKQAIQIYTFEYDLLLRWDLNTQSNMQWYYFSVSNTRQGQKYVFNIINMVKPNSLYNEGMKPCVYSERASKLKNIGWVRDGQDICYYQNTMKKSAGSCYFTLTFSFTAAYSNDTIYFAHSYPYTYTDLTKDLDMLVYDPKKRMKIRRSVLCQTIAGNSCDLVTITSFNSKPEAMKHRRGVVLFSRVHPGESNSSYVMKGIIDYLTGPNLQAKILRDNFIFKIVPMLNPDGVIYGNNRCGLSGIDLNRCWMEPSKKLHPTIFYAKTMLKQFAEENEVILSCDFHGHSRKKNIFMYGCVGKSKNKEKIFPKLLERISDVFSFKDCVFAMQKAKESTARIVIYKELGIINSFTLESSFCGANFGPHADFHFNQEHLMQVGHDFCEALLDFCSPDQLKVKAIMEEVELMSPFEEEIADEALEIETERNKKRRRSKKPVIKKKNSSRLRRDL